MSKKRSFFPVLTHHSDREKTGWTARRAYRFWKPTTVRPVPGALARGCQRRRCLVGDVQLCQVPWPALRDGGCLQPGRPDSRSRDRFSGAGARARPIGAVCPALGRRTTTPQSAGARGGLTGRSLRRSGQGRPGQRPPPVRTGGAGKRGGAARAPDKALASRRAGGWGLGAPRSGRRPASRGRVLTVKATPIGGDNGQALGRAAFVVVSASCRRQKKGGACAPPIASSRTIRVPGLHPGRRHYRCRSCRP